MIVEPRMIRAARALLGMDQRELARGAGLSVRTLVTVEQGGASGRSHRAAVGYLLMCGITFRRSGDGSVIGVAYDPPAHGSGPAAPQAAGAGAGVGAVRSGSRGIAHSA